jgi:hypothetical protein
MKLRGRPMNDYDIHLVYDQFIIHTIVYADNEEQAKRVAWQKLTQDEGLSLGLPIEYRIELQGSFTK